MRWYGWHLASRVTVVRYRCGLSETFAGERFGRQVGRGAAVPGRAHPRPTSDPRETPWHTRCSAAGTPAGVCPRPRRSLRNRRSCGSVWYVTCPTSTGARQRAERRDAVERQGPPTVDHGRAQSDPRQQAFPRPGTGGGPCVRDVGEDAEIIDIGGVGCRRRPDQRRLRGTRLGATCATTALGTAAGVRVFRVHDVRPNRQAAIVA